MKLKQRKCTWDMMVLPELAITVLFTLSNHFYVHFPSCLLPLCPVLLLLADLSKYKQDRIASTCLYCSVSSLVTPLPYNTFRLLVQLSSASHGWNLLFFSAFLPKLVSLSLPNLCNNGLRLHCGKFSLIIRKYFAIVNIAKCQNELPPQAVERFR